MDARKLILGAAAYTICTFSLAVGWHVVLFEERYASFGYFDGQPNLLVGLLTVVLQGVLLSMLFPMLRVEGSSFHRGLKFVLIVGAFFWTSHVLSFIARQEVPEVSAFIWMETVYLALQFGLFGLILGVIHRRGDSA